MPSKEKWFGVDTASDFCNAIGIGVRRVGGTHYKVRFGLIYGDFHVSSENRWIGSICGLEGVKKFLIETYDPRMHDGRLKGHEFVINKFGNDGYEVLDITRQSEMMNVSCQKLLSSEAVVFRSKNLEECHEWIDMDVIPVLSDLREKYKVVKCQ